MTALAAVVGLSGCATPYVVKLPESKKPTDTRSSQQAQAYLSAVGQGFRNAVEGQVSDEHVASNAFIGAGALVTALTLGKVHRDGVLAAVTLAGTGYAVANNNLPRSRLQTYAESLKATNCAERAFSPLVILDSDKTKLAEAVVKLKESRQLLLTELRAARVKRDEAPGADEWRKAFPAAEDVVNEILEQTRQSHVAADAFVDASERGAMSLTSWVTMTHDNAIVALAEARAPLAEVPRLVQGLAKDLGTFAPGSGVEGLVADSLKNASKSGVSQSSVGSQSELAKALERLDVRARETARLQAPVNRALSGRNTTFAEDAFRDCNVAKVLTPLTVPTPPITLSAQDGGQRVVEMRGGAEPYFIQLDGAPVTGLSFPVGPIRSGEAEISLKAGAMSTGVKTQLRVTDSSATRQSVRVEVEIVGPTPAAAAASAAASAAAATAAAKTAAAAKAAAAAKVAADKAAAEKAASADAAATADKTKATESPGADIDQALAALKKVSKFSIGDKSFERKNLPAKVGDRIEVVVLCPAGNTVTFKRGDLVGAYLGAAKVTNFPADKLAVTTEPAACAPK